MNPTLGYILLGLVAGFASGCFGIGGGIVIVPVLMLAFKVDYHVAVGTSLAMIIPISLAGSAANFSLGKINWNIFTAGVQAALVGTETPNRPPREQTTRALGGLYTAGDGRHFLLALTSELRQWPALARAIGLPELTSDPRFIVRNPKACRACQGACGAELIRQP